MLDLAFFIGPRVFIFVIYMTNGSRPMFPQIRVILPFCVVFAPGACVQAPRVREVPTMQNCFLD